MGIVLSWITIVPYLQVEGKKLVRFHSGI